MSQVQAPHSESIAVSIAAQKQPPALPSEFSPAEVDLEGFSRELEALHRAALAKLGDKDYRHLRKMERWGRLCTLLGYGTAWILPNPISAYLISQGNVARWALMTHHITHRGYDRLKDIPKRYHGKHFAKGWRRFWDWPDWILPSAWNFEHNTLHHYHTGESEDPDCPEQNVELLRNIKIPIWLKYLILFYFMCNWKLIYYAPNTLWTEYKLRARKKQGSKTGHSLKGIMAQEPMHQLYHGAKILLPTSAAGREYWLRCLLPYFSYRFLCLPLLFAPLGLWACGNVLLNSMLAEVFANIHSFLIIAPNHTGSDLYRFEGPIRNKQEFYLRQIVGSVNYHCGNEITDFLQGWLNYQIEHHLWPDLPMHTYRELQPQVEALCHKYGIPYRKESVWKRVGKMLAVLSGRDSMPVLNTQINT